MNYEQTSPLDVHTYAFGQGPYGLQFVRSVPIFCILITEAIVECTAAAKYKKLLLKPYFFPYLPYFRGYGCILMQYNIISQMSSCVKGKIPIFSIFRDYRLISLTNFSICAIVVVRHKSILFKTVCTFFPFGKNVRFFCIRF